MSWLTPKRQMVGIFAAVTLSGLVSACETPRYYGRHACIIDYDESLKQNVVIPELIKRGISNYAKLDIDNPVTDHRQGRLVVFLLFNDPNMIDGPIFSISIDACTKEVINFGILDSTIVMKSRP